MTIDPAAVQKKLDKLLIPGLDAPGGGLPGLPASTSTQPPKIQ